MENRTHCISKLKDEADIVVIGACLFEIITYTHCIPKENEITRGYSIQERYSGKGANQCIAAAKLGASVALISKLGDDSNGKRYLEELQKYPINTKYVWLLRDVPTGVSSVAINTENAQQTILVPGANDYLSLTDLDAAKDMLLKAKVIVCQGETPWETSLYCLSNLLVSSQSTAIIVLNPSPAVYPLHPLLLVLADIVCVNEREAGIITNMKINCEEDIIDCVNTLIFDMKCNTVIVTMGPSGVVYATKDSPRLKTVKVEPVETSSDAYGVGDCFVGALAFYLCYFPHLPLGEQIIRSSYIARQSLYSPGLQDSFPDKKSLCYLNEKLFSPCCKFYKNI